MVFYNERFLVLLSQIRSEKKFLYISVKDDAENVLNAAVNPLGLCDDDCVRRCIRSC